MKVLSKIEMIFWSLSGRDMLYPIVGYSNYASILWRLHYAKLKFHQTAPLPFDRVETLLLLYLQTYFSIQAHVQAQTELFCYVIKQLNSRDLTFSLVGVARNIIFQTRKSIISLFSPD